MRKHPGVEEEAFYTFWAGFVEAGLASFFASFTGPDGPIQQQTLAKSRTVGTSRPQYTIT